MSLRRGVLEIDGMQHAARLGRALHAAFALPIERVRVARLPRAVLRIEVRSWLAADLDPFGYDVLAHRAIDAGAEVLVLDGRGSARSGIVRAAREIALRYQRLLPRAPDPLVDAALARHRALHDLSKPLVRADFDHALDVFRWILRLAPDASREVQCAALFHDVERLVSEADVRVEQHATDYQAFKDAHARGSAAIAGEVLGDLFPATSLDRIAQLVTRHEQAGPKAARDDEAWLLGEADALSFFSVNLDGYVRYYGETQTRKKVAWTLRRLGPRGLGWLRRLRLRHDLRALVDQTLSGDRAA